MITIISHIYNEQYLLPWWLKHHTQICSHGIIIDYNSTDSSLAIIKELAPNWQVIPSRNKYFDSASIDREVEDIERDIQGWRVCLNTTEFLLGNYHQLEQIKEPSQKFLANMVFVDVTGDDIQTEHSLVEQRCYGYIETTSCCDKLNRGARPRRSIHNYPIVYPSGRHYNDRQSFNDLYIAYHGYSVLTEQGLARKFQIRDKMSDYERGLCGSTHPNTLSQHDFFKNITQYHQPRCQDLTLEVAELVKKMNK